jgi:integrase
LRRKTLSNLGVAALKPHAARYAFPDPELRGHYVRVSPTGAKSYAVVRRDPGTGKQIWAAIGTADVMNIEDARTRARVALQRIKEGLPAIEPKPVAAETFQQVSENWLKRHVQARGLRSEPEIRRALDKYVLPDLADREFVSIRRSDVASLLDRIQDDHGARQADLVLAYLRAMANWFATRNDNYVPPFARGMRRQAPTKRERILTDDELRAVWRQAEKAGTFGAIVRMALLTAQRREKVASMRWADISGGVWTVAAGEREKGAGGTLRLPPAAVAIIEQRPRLASNPFVFAGRGDVAFNGFSKGKAAFDVTMPKLEAPDGTEMEIPNWTLHDLRRTARSLMSRAGVRPDIAERVLGHVIGGVKGVYDRHRYGDEKSEALAKLAEMISAIVGADDGRAK